MARVNSLIAPLKSFFIYKSIPLFRALFANDCKWAEPWLAAENISIVDAPSSNDMSGYIPFLAMIIQPIYRPVASLTLGKKLPKYVQHIVIF
jgi:hypothetical protein